MVEDDCYDNSNPEIDNLMNEKVKGVMKSFFGHDNRGRSNHC